MSYISGYIYEDEDEFDGELHEIDVQFASDVGDLSKIFVDGDLKVMYNPKFDPLFKAALDQRYILNFGGRGSGKSFVLALAAVIDVADHNYKNNIMVARYNMTTSDISTKADIDKAIDILGLNFDFVKTKNIYTHKNGNTIFFWGLASNNSANSAKNKSLSDITRLYIEEANEIRTFEEFAKIDQSIRSTISPLRIVLTYNPTSIYDCWIHDEYFEDGQPDKDRFDDTVFIHSNYIDNKANLEESTIASYIRTKKKKPDYYKNVFLGEYVRKVENQIYEHFDFWPTFPDRDDPDVQTWYGFDPNSGGNDESAGVRVDYFDGVYFVEEVFSEKTRSTNDVIDLFNANIDRRFQIIADSENPMLLNDIRSKGFNKLRAFSKTANSVKEGIDLINSAEIIIVGDSPNLRKGFHSWKYDDKGKITMHEPDALAAMRYALTRHIYHTRNKHGRKTGLRKIG